MEPGHKLDSAIAEKFFKWKKCTPYGHTGYSWHYTKQDKVEISHSMDQDGSKYSQCNCYTHNKIDPNSFKPSVDISAAMKVAEEMKNQGFSVSINLYPSDRKWLKAPYKGAPAREWSLVEVEQHYQCSLSVYSKDSKEGECWLSYSDPIGNSVPHVICLAALSTLDGKMNRG